MATNSARGIALELRADAEAYMAGKLSDAEHEARCAELWAIARRMGWAYVVERILAILAREEMRESARHDEARRPG